MNQIIINNCAYNIHPIYNLNAASQDGYVINIIKRIPLQGNKQHNGYLNCVVRKHGQSGQKTYKVHRFVFECFNGLIPEGKVIDHANNIRDDNRLCNLQVLTSSQNSKKSAPNRDYSFVKDNHKNRKCVKATNKDTGESSYYYSMYATQQNLSINHSIIKFICENQKYYKTGISKKDGCSLIRLNMSKKKIYPQIVLNPKI